MRLYVIGAVAALVSQSSPGGQATPSADSVLVTVGYRLERRLSGDDRIEVSYQRDGARVLRRVVRSPNSDAAWIDTPGGRPATLAACVRVVRRELAGEAVCDTARHHPPRRRTTEPSVIALVLPSSVPLPAAGTARRDPPVGRGEPANAARGGRAAIDEDFGRYRSMRHYWSDPNGWLRPAPRWMNQSRISLDEDEAYGGRGKSLRFDWPAGGCGTERQISAVYQPPTASELWIEVPHKFAANFDPMEKPCGGSAYKMIFFWQDNGSRFDLVNGVNGSHWFANNPQSPPCRDGPEYGDGTGVDCSMIVPELGRMGTLRDGRWHVYRFHIKLSSCPTCADGRYRIWVDGKLVLDRRNRAIVNSRNGKWSDRLSSIVLGGNANNGPREETSTWWGALTVHTRDPGW